MSAAKARELALVFRETVALYLRLSADASAIHGFGALSGPRRTVLVALAELGPQTVAHLARARGQSRQRLQPVINALIEAGLVAPEGNPLHKRSPLMVLTAAGDRHVERIVQTEQALEEQLRPGSSTKELSQAAAVLRDVRETLQRQMPQLLQKQRASLRRRRRTVNS